MSGEVITIPDYHQRLLKRERDVKILYRSPFVGGSMVWVGIVQGETEYLDVGFLSYREAVEIGWVSE